ncbi:unnamed protein product [Aureobasidium pullulans]|nr:unnamed protein product [Aureobasidium pullulans]
MSLPNTSLKTMSSAPPKKHRTWKKKKPHQWVDDPEFRAPLHKNSFAKPAPATSLAEWDESHADQVPLTYASSGKRNLRSELVREHIWPMASRCSMRKIRWIWIYHNKDCHDLAPYAFSERKTPYWEYKDVTLPVPAETESTPQDPPTHNPPNQMPQENPKPGSSTEFAVVIKDEPDVRVVKQERETTANVCGMEAANESLSAVQPFHIPQPGFPGIQTNLSEPQAGSLGLREDRILDTDSRPRQLILEEMAPIVSRYYELWAKLKSIHALEQIQKDVVQQPFPLQSLNMPAPMPGHQWHEHMNALGQSALPFLPPHPDPQPLYSPNIPMTNAVSPQVGHSRSRQTVRTFEHKTAPCSDTDGSDDSDGCPDPVELLDNGNSSVRSCSSCDDDDEVSSSAPKQSSSTAKRRDKQIKDKHHSAKKRSHGDKSPDRVNTNAPRHVKKKSIQERSVQSDGCTSSNNNAGKLKRKREDVASGVEGNSDDNSSSDAETSPQRKKGSAKVDERPSASSKHKTEERKVCSKSENTTTPKETSKKKKKAKSSHDREHSQHHPKSKSPAVSRIKAKSEPPRPVKTEKRKPEKSKRADGREAYDSVHLDRRSLIESS